MDISKRKKRGGYKRPHVKKPSLHSYAKPGLLAALSTVPTVAPLTLSPAITPMLQPEKSFGELLGEVVGEIVVKAFTAAWEKASPGSYALNRTIYAIAPYCGPEAAGALNFGALITFSYGVKQIADSANRRGH